MKKGILVGYATALSITFLMQSCQQDPILSPNLGQNNADTTWVGDSTFNNDPNGGGNGTPNDSTFWGNGNGNDSTWVSGGTGSPNDSTGGNWNPGDTL